MSYAPKFRPLPRAGSWASGPALAADCTQARERSLELRRSCEQFNKALRQALPFRFEVATKELSTTPGFELRPERRQVEHILLLEPCDVAGVRRQAGDLLCSTAIDYDTGELRFTGRPVEAWRDAEGVEYTPKVSCKNCLKTASRIAIEQAQQ